MKKLLLICIASIATLTLATASPATETQSVDEQTFEMQGSANQFIRQYKISLRTSVASGDFAFTMTSGQPMPFDTMIWYVLRLTMWDGTTRDINVIPTIYQGNSASSPIQIPGISSAQVSSYSQVSVTIIQPTEW